MFASCNIRLWSPGTSMRGGLTNYSILAKVSGAFGLVFIVTMTLGLFAVSRLATVNAAVVAVRDHWQPATLLLADVAVQGERLRLTQNTVMQARTDSERQAAEERFASFLAARDKAWREYEKFITDGKERQLANAIQSSWNKYFSLS